MILCGIERVTKPPVFLFVAFCDDCGNTHSFECCPDCGAWIAEGFGLAAGGCGPYSVCDELCGWIHAPRPPRKQGGGRA